MFGKDKSKKRKKNAINCKLYVMWLDKVRKISKFSKGTVKQVECSGRWWTLCLPIYK